MAQIFFNPKSRRFVRVCTVNTHTADFIHPRRVLGLHDILYCIEGSMEVYIDKTPFLMQQDDVLILPAGIMHYGKKTCLDGTRLYAMHFNAADGDYYGTANEDSDKYISFSPLVSCKTCPEVKNIFQHIAKSFWSNSIYKKDKISHLVNLLIIFLGECDKEQTNGGDVVSTTIRYIRNHISENLSSSEIAEAIHISERELRRIFVRETGSTPYTYLRMIRLEYAEMLMREYPNRKINSIARDVGIEDELYFSKIFKKFYGESPTEHKKRIANGGALPLKSQREYDEHSFDYTKEIWKDEDYTS